MKVDQMNYDLLKVMRAKIKALPIMIEWHWIKEKTLGSNGMFKPTAWQKPFGFIVNRQGRN